MSDTEARGWRPFPGIVLELPSSESEDGGNTSRALYAILTAAFHFLDPQEWGVWVALAEQARTEAELLEVTDIDEATIAKIIRRFVDDFKLIYPATESPDLALTFNPTSYEAYIEVTQRCNFGCSGCASGVDQRRLAHEPARELSLAQIEGSLRALARSAQANGYTHLRVKWAGGEALLVKDKISQAQAIIARIAEEFSLTIKQILLTNGSLLTAEMAEFLKARDIYTSVSLWGGEIDSIALRHPKMSSGYERTVAGIRHLVEAGAPYNVNHVIGPGNAAGFAAFITQLWDTDSPTFIGKEWQWPDGQPYPLPLSFAFFRPQWPFQLQQLERGGYAAMLAGLRAGFQTIRELIARGLPIQPLTKLDYMNAGQVQAAPCGTGKGYVAVGPGGAASCHQQLPAQKTGIDQVLADAHDRDFMHGINAQRGDWRDLAGPNIPPPEGIDPLIWVFLALHGGIGCPDVRLMETGSMQHAGSIVTALYAPLVEEWLALEAYRQAARGAAQMPAPLR